MNKKWVSGLWTGLFILCAGLGFIPQPEGFLKTALRIVSLLFFLPPVLLLLNARRTRDTAYLLLVRNLSLLSLGLTLLLIVLNILAAPGPELLGGILNSILIIVSSPMVACGSWAVSLFLWACLLMGSLSLLKKTR